MYTTTAAATARNNTRGEAREGRPPQERVVAPSSGRDGPTRSKGWTGTVTDHEMRTVVRAWPVRVAVARGWAMLSDGASEARAGHGALLVSTAARAARHCVAASRPFPTPVRAHHRHSHTAHTPDTTHLTSGSADDSDSLESSYLV